MRASSVTTARAADAALDCAIFSLAAWTVIYHFCLVTGVTAGWAAGAEVLVLCSCLWWAWRGARLAADGEVSRRSEQDQQGEPGQQRVNPRASVASLTGRRVQVSATVLPAVFAAALFAARVGPWWLIWGLWACAAVGGIAGAFFGNGVLPAGASGKDSSGGRARTNGAGVALAWASGLAAFSLFLIRSDGDDAYYVNLAGWVAEHGTFPLRDTVMSDLAYPATYWPPVASYDALVGTLSRFSPLATLDVVYFVVPPVATFLAVLALWRLLRAWDVAAVGVALTLALLFLLWGGTHHYSFGNHFIGRIWQGKILFLWLAVPLLLYYLQRFCERPSRNRLAVLFAAGVAGVGFSTNAMFLTPLIAAAGVVPLLFKAPRQAVTGFVATAIYPLGAAVVTLAVGGYVGADYASMTEIIVPEWLTHLVLGEGFRAGIALLAVLVGALVVRRRGARIIIAALVVVAAVVYAPAMPGLLFEVTGLGRTLHRVVWIVPVAALIGALGATAVTALRPRMLQLGVPLVLAVGLAVSGLPLWSTDNEPAWLSPVPRWKLPSGTVSATREIVRHTRPDDIVVAPTALSQTLAIMDPEVLPLLPRDFFANPLQDVPSFHAAKRLRLKKFAQGKLGPGRMGEIPESLRVLSVDMACLGTGNAAGARLLERQGYVQAFRTADYQCYSATDTGTTRPG